MTEPLLFISVQQLSAEVHSPANTPFAMPASPFVSQLNPASLWETGKINFVVNAEPTLLREPACRAELQLTGDVQR